jgi:hypothetical protein
MLVVKSVQVMQAELTKLSFAFAVALLEYSSIGFSTGIGLFVPARYILPPAANLEPEASLMGVGGVSSIT